MVAAQPGRVCLITVAYGSSTAWSCVLDPSSLYMSSMFKTLRNSCCGWSCCVFLVTKYLKCCLPLSDDEDIRLVNKTRIGTGSVEMLQDGAWVTLKNSTMSFKPRDLCRELGFDEGSQLPGPVTNNTGTIKMHMHFSFKLLHIF